MPDVGPDELAVQRLRLQRQHKQVELNVFDSELRLAEMEQEKKRLTENIKASKAALTDLETEIAELGGEKEMNDG